MSMACLCLLIPFAEVCFLERLCRDLHLLEADWRGQGFGKWAWSTFKLERLKYILAKGFAKAFARLVTQSQHGRSSDPFPHAGLYIYGNPLGHFTSKKYIKMCIGVEAWCARDNSFSVKPLNTTILPATWDRKRWCVWRVVFKKKLVPSMNRNSFPNN